LNEAELTSDQLVSESVVQQIMGGKRPVATGVPGRIGFAAKRVDTYVWRGLIRKYPLYVYFSAGDDPTVLSVTTEREKTAAELYPAPSADEILKLRCENEAATRARYPKAFVNEPPIDEMFVPADEPPVDFDTPDGPGQPTKITD
jgi:hypothetical protein